MPDSSTDVHPTDNWELVDSNGQRRATGTYERCHAVMREAANAEFQNKRMMPGFTLRRVPRGKASKRK